MKVLLDTFRNEVHADVLRLQGLVLVPDVKFQRPGRLSGRSSCRSAPWVRTLMVKVHSHLSRGGGVLEMKATLLYMLIPTVLRCRLVSVSRCVATSWLRMRAVCSVSKALSGSQRNDQAWSTLESAHRLLDMENIFRASRLVKILQ